MHIVQVASEVAPVAKVGGLADVIMGLDHELKGQGHQVEAIIPKYDCLDTSELSLQHSKTGVRSFFNGAWHENSIWYGQYNKNLQLTFIESHAPQRFFDRGCIYGCHDDVDRFLYFCRTVLDWLSEQETTPDIIHIHDWVTAPIAFLIRQGPFRTRFEKTRVVFTIHNIAYQGRCQASDLDKIGVPGAWFDAPHRLQDDFSSDLNLLKGAIVFSDFITTVSPTYAKEVLTPEGGKGLHLTLDRHREKFSGILNGIDYSYWNPEIDDHLSFNYSLKEKNESGLAAKQKNTQQVRQMLNMSQDETKPLVVSICRLVQQKGVDLIKHAIMNAHKKGMQYIVLGTAPDPAIQWEFADLAHRYGDDPDVRILLQQEESLAHHLYAASDMFLMPSLFEPCGLTQLIALKYGSIPIVRNTGGLSDTVFDVDHSEKQVTNGFSFDFPDAASLDSALDRALAFWKRDKADWQQLMKRAMECDFSWHFPASDYITVYEKILKQHIYSYETDSTTTG